MTYQIVHLRSNDKATGQATPVRLRLGYENRYFPPLGRPHVVPVGRREALGGNVRIGGRAYAYIDGACEVRLPAGPLQVEISKGPEYTPILDSIDLHAGQLSLRFQIERRFDWTADGWYAGDTHAQFLTPNAAGLEGAAEGLRFVNLLASEASLPDLLEFSGQESASTTRGSTVVVNTLNEGGDLGRLALLNCHRVVYPLTLEAIGFERYTLADWCGQCHRKGGLVVWPQFPQQPGEAIADLLLGEIDAIEWTAEEPFGSIGLPEWYRLLNLGVRVPLVGGSGKVSNAVPLGLVRTYAQVSAAADGKGRSGYLDWIEAVRSGRTFVTRGPLVRLRAAGQGAGSELALDKVGDEVPINAEAVSLRPFERLEVVRDGEVIGTAQCDASGCATIAMFLPVGASGWLAARCSDAEGLVAHTSPIYLAGTRRIPDRSLAAPLYQRLDWLTAFAEDFATDAEQQRHLLEIAARAREVLEKRLT